MTYDEALALSQQQDFESPSETEEREVIEAGRILDIEDDREAVDRADEIALDFAERMAQEATLDSYRTHCYY